MGSVEDVCVCVWCVCVNSVSSDFMGRDDEHTEVHDAGSAPDKPETPVTVRASVTCMLKRCGRDWNSLLTRNK